MNYLLFFITSIFSAVLFVFYKLNNGENIFSGFLVSGYYFSSLTGNLFIDSILFLILAIFLFFYFSNFRFIGKNNKKIEKNLEDYEENYNLSEENIENNLIIKKINLKSFFSKYIYYIGFLLFYISIYLILYSFGISDFNYIILFLNIIIIVFFFLSHKADIFKDFIKINTILFSLYYIFLFLYIFITEINNINLIDFVNTLFIFSFFIITFYGNYKKRNILEKNNNLKNSFYRNNTLNNNILEIDNSLILYFFIYSFIVFSFYFRIIFVDYMYFKNINFSLIFVYIAIFLNIFSYFVLQKVKIFENSRYILRALSFLFGYISIIFSIIFFIKNINFDFISGFSSTFNNFIIFFILIYGIIFNFEVHKKFQNYISLFFSLISFVFILNFVLYKNFDLFGINKANLILILNFTISYFIIIFTYLYSQKYNFDYFFLHICAYFINILGIIYYLVFGNFEILNFGIILLLDSILIFLSYFKLKKINKRER